MALISIPPIYLLHGHRGSPTGSVLTLENRLREHIPDADIFRPPIEDGTLNPAPKPNALLVGLSLGGLWAAKYTELRPDIKAVAISSPTWFDGLRLQSFLHDRVFALYSNEDPIVKGRTDWEKFTTRYYDRVWLKDHDLEPHINSVVLTLIHFLSTGDFSEGVEAVDAMIHD